MARIVLWSGGMDSTLLLKQQASDFPNDQINALTVLQIGNSDGQIKSESKTRKNLLKKLPSNIKHDTVRVKTTYYHNTWQMPIWLGYLIPQIQNGDIVCMGYLSSDGFDFWSHKEKLENAFKAHMKLMGNDKAELTFPLQCYTKGNVIKELKKYKLLKYCWYCGKPKNGKPCGKCTKCLSYKRWSIYPEVGEYV